jgi:hypothetical protein
MVLTKSDEVHPDLVGENRFFNHVTKDLRLRLQFSIATAGNVTEGVEPKFQFFHGVKLISNRWRTGISIGS